MKSIRIQLKAYLVSSKQINESHIVKDVNGKIGNVLYTDIVRGDIQILLGF